MKIKVTTERDCCAPEDLVKYSGRAKIPDVWKPKFCKHCGQLWYLQAFTDAAGSRDTEYVAYVPDLT